VDEPIKGYMAVSVVEEHGTYVEEVL